MADKKILNRHDWQIAYSGPEHVVVSAYEATGFRCFDRLTLAELPSYLSRIEREEHIQFGPWPERLRLPLDPEKLPSFTPDEPFSGTVAALAEPRPEGAYLALGTQEYIIFADLSAAQYRADRADGKWRVDAPRGGRQIRAEHLDDWADRHLWEACDAADWCRAKRQEGAATGFIVRATQSPLSVWRFLMRCIVPPKPEALNRSILFRFDPAETTPYGTVHMTY